VVVVNEFLVINSEKVKDRGVEIVNTHPIFDGVIAKFIRCTIHRPSLYASPGEPHGKTCGSMISAGILVALRKR